MATVHCTAPAQGHQPGSQAERECPVHGTHATSPMSALQNAAPTLQTKAPGPRPVLNEEMEFDGAYAILTDGTIERASAYVPSFIDNEVESSDWEAISGFTGQYGYNGPVMHNSEQLSGGIEDYVWENPGIYAIVEAQYTTDANDNEIDPDDPDGLYGEGWVLLRKKEPDDPAKPMPQDRVPGWEGGMSRGPTPKVIGTVIRAVGPSGKEGQYTLDRRDVLDPRYPRQSTGIWVNVFDPNESLHDNQVEQWMPSFFPNTDEGNLAHAYHNAMSHLYAGNVASDRAEQAMLGELGIDGARFVAALSADGSRQPRTMLYNSNADGSRHFRVMVARDENGAAQVLADGDVGSQRAKRALEYMTNNAERIAAWRDERARLEAVSQEARSIGTEFNAVAWEWPT